MPPKSTPPAGQPSVSQFFKRKSPPPPSTLSSPTKSTASSAKRVKFNPAGPSATAARPFEADGIIVLDSDDDQAIMDVDLDDVQIVEQPAASPMLAARPGENSARAHPSLVASSTAPCRVNSNSAVPFATSTSRETPSFFSKQPAKPSAKRRTFHPRDSVATQALRTLTYVEPTSSQHDSLLDDTQPVAGPSRLPVSPEAQREKDERHKRFATKLLGRSFGRRRSFDLDEAEAAAARAEFGEAGSGEDNQVVEVDGDEETAVTKAGKGKLGEIKSRLTAPTKRAAGKKRAAPEVGPSGLTYTPLEMQVKELKAANPGVLLIFEVGYKFRFFGEDSKTAAKLLNIVAFPDRNFYTASIPVHRLFIHIRNLIANGYKVGVVRQMETAALKKVGSNRSAPFTRKLAELYTASTWVDELASSDDGAVGFTSVPPSNALIALVEVPAGKGKGRSTNGAADEVKIGLISVVPSTGDVIWDEFTDGPARTELETRITHIQPQEVLLSLDKLSNASEKLLQQLLSPGSTGVRCERVEFDLEPDECLSLVTQFWKKKGGSSVDKVKALVDFPETVVTSLAYAIRYLEDFNLSSSLSHTDTTFRRFSTQSHMLLNANTLTNLEVYQNSDDGGEKGSLMWLLDATTTKMGRRQLREWVGRPLVDKKRLHERIDAVFEIATDESERVPKLKSLLKGLPDLPRGLVRIHSGRATPAELITVLKHFERIAIFSDAAKTINFASPLLSQIFDALDSLTEPLARYLEAIHEFRARANDKAALWKDKDKYPQIEDTRDLIQICEHELQEELEEIRKVMKRPGAMFATVAGVENLIEIRVSDVKKVPLKWIKVSSTKNVIRYHTPEVLRIAQEKEQHKETLAAEADKAYMSFLAEVSESYDVFRTVANHIATLDCIMSLSHTANLPGYCKPELTDEHQLVCEGAFHPMVAAVLDGTYVPNDVNMSASHGRTKVITGPNMGGKSSMVRTLALIVLMAQIGAYVPATSVKLGVHDAIYTRMGASDDILHGRSTFMVEISETSDVIRQATPASLVILDELGRGTSTYDGQALAEAVLHYLVTQVQCNTLFITHYPLVATSLSKQLADVSNWHMGFSQRPRPDGSSQITFLYRLAAGLAKASFGIECARLAGVPDVILANATAHARALEDKVEQRTAALRSQRMADLLKAALHDDIDYARTADADKTIRQAHALLSIL